MGGGHVQQGGGGGASVAAVAAAPPPSYDHHHGAEAGDAGDAVTARWLQSAGLQHLASNGIDQRLLPNLLMQGYGGGQTAEEKQRVFKLLRNLNFNGDPGSEPYTPSAQSSSGLEGFYSPELRGEFGAGLLDLHSMDDSELLTRVVHLFSSQHVVSEPFEPSPFMPPLTRGFDEFDIMTGRQQRGQVDGSIRLPANEKESSGKESNLAKIKVVVRKRPLNKKEISRKEDDIVTVHNNAYLSVHEPKLKVDLTAYVEKHEFCFDAVLDEYVNNDENSFYSEELECSLHVLLIVSGLFFKQWYTDNALRRPQMYRLQGSGKTFTMQPLPIRASEDIVRLLHHPNYRSQKFRLWLSYFEIYGGKLYDLLSDRRKLCMREDGRQQVCIVGLQEFEVSDVQVVKDFIEKGNASRSTGSTGANEESSRSHAILQLAIKKHNEVIESKRYNDGNELRGGKVIGKISFIDLAGSERGADTTDNDRQTRIEGAEINKSLLALKECIRALDNDQIHIPFRGSKLTEVLRDSFVGNSRTVMISCISPNAGSCEHTLNTLRYADRVKSLSKSGNPRKDQIPTSLLPAVKDSSTSSFPGSFEMSDFHDQNQDVKMVDIGQRTKENISYNSTSEFERHTSSMALNYPHNGREESAASSFERERLDLKNRVGGSLSHKSYPYSQSMHDAQEDEIVQKVSPPRRKAVREEKPERQGNWQKKDNTVDPSTTGYKQQLAYGSNVNNVTLRHLEPEVSYDDGEINALLEEEEALISAHRKEIEDTMEIVRERIPHLKTMGPIEQVRLMEMKLLAEVDQPGSAIDNYVSQLNFVLSRKAAGLVSLQARLARFQHRLKEQEILSRKVPR
ncbi:Diatom spindle kinesin 1 [Acorus calamus]|uniref:Kinesin-like protein n=1 Tax=Acorus calamus TaxID=4465 RepID=A0AAV9CZ83_ACOCL|nr:Diatom spindle kinesin 1 [Acorus calamus]